jgi:hypothetical protein
VRYFGTLTPNTFVVKGGPHADDALSLVSLGASSMSRLHELYGSVASPLNGVFLLATPLAIVALLRGSSVRRAHLLVLGATSISAAVYVLMPDDWMPEFRFATVFMVFVHDAAGLAAADLLDRADDRRSRLRRAALAGVLAVLAAGMSVYRVRVFAKEPTVPFAMTWRGGRFVRGT